MTIGWDDGAGCVRLDARDVWDFSSRSRHTYTIQLRPEEVGRALTALAESAGGARQKDVARALAPHLPALFRLATACAWPEGLPRSPKLPASEKS